GGEQVAGAALGFQPLALETEGAARIGAGRYCQFHRTVERRHADFSAEHRFIERDGQIEPQVGAIWFEQRMWCDMHRDQRIASFAGCTRPALTFEPDGLAGCKAGWNLHFDVLTGRQMHAGFDPLGGFRQANGQFGVKVLAGAGRAEFLRLELGSEATRRATEHATQDVLEAATTAGCALKPVMVKVEAFEMTGIGPGAAPLRAKTFEAVEARLALGVDLAVIERFALLIVAGDLISGIELGKA